MSPSRLVWPATIGALVLLGAFALAAGLDAATAPVRLGLAAPGAGWVLSGLGGLVMVTFLGHRSRIMAGLLHTASAIALGSGLWLALLEGVRFAPDQHGWMPLMAAILLSLWRGMAGLAEGTGWATRIAVPVLFGGSLIYVWEVLAIGFDIPIVLLPAPSQILDVARAGAGHILWPDFVQTFVRAVVPGYLMGCGAGFTIALLIDRSPFLQRGLKPMGSLISAMPIVGIAPIMVIWFGFDWQSKAAVVVVMTVFPMLVNTLAGLEAAGAMERDLMRSYGAGYGQILVKLRLPAALPFIFNALKINATLALIGAIVAEFFGTPIKGMGFRISSEVGRLGIDMVWATILVAAISGSVSYGLLALAERRLTFWHPSQRRRA